MSERIYQYRHLNEVGELLSDAWMDCDADEFETFAQWPEIERRIVYAALSAGEAQQGSHASANCNPATCEICAKNYPELAKEARALTPPRQMVADHVAEGGKMVAPSGDDQKVLYNLCAALVDICDDTTNNPPESRAYVDGAYGETVSELRELLLSVAPTGAEARDAADMFWHKDDPESSHSDIEDMIGYFGLVAGEEITVQRAVSLPDIRIRVTRGDGEENPDYEVIDAAPAAEQERPTQAPENGE